MPSRSFLDEGDVLPRLGEQSADDAADGARADDPDSHAVAFLSR